MAPLSSVTLDPRGTWRRLSMGPSPYFSLSLLLSLISHKARQNKIKLPRREFPSPRAHMPSCSGSTSYFHIRGRNCHGVPRRCPHRNSVWPQTPVSSLGEYAIEGERARKKKEVIKVTELTDRFVGVLVYGNDSHTHTHTCRRGHAGNAILARKGTYFRIPLCTRICHASGSITSAIISKAKKDISFPWKMHLNVLIDIYI